MTTEEVSQVRDTEPPPERQGLSLDEDLLDVDLFAWAKKLSTESADLSDMGYAVAAQRFARALLLQTQQRFPREEGSPYLEPSAPFLVSAIVRRGSAGEIRVIAGGRWNLVDTHARCHVLESPFLLVPGMSMVVEPHDAIVLGVWYTAEQAMKHFARMQATELHVHERLSQTQLEWINYALKEMPT